jgi:hypothetical protein
MSGPMPMLAAFIAAVFAMPVSGATAAAPAQQVTTLTYVTASAATAPGAETRVRASSAGVAVHAEPSQHIAAGQRLGKDVAGPQIVVATGVAANGGDEAFHYTSSRWIESITANGLRKGSYATPNGSLSPLQASLELALPPNRALPNAAIRIDLAGLRKAGYKVPTPTRVSSTVTGAGGRTYSMPGGGYEIQFPYSIPSEFLKVVPR